MKKILSVLLILSLLFLVMGCSSSNDTDKIEETESIEETVTEQEPADTVSSGKRITVDQTLIYVNDLYSTSVDTIEIDGDKMDVDLTTTNNTSENLKVNQLFGISVFQGDTLISNKVENKYFDHNATQLGYPAYVAGQPTSVDLEYSLKDSTTPVTIHIKPGEGTGYEEGYTFMEVTVDPATGNVETVFDHY